MFLANSISKEFVAGLGRVPDLTVADCSLLFNLHLIFSTLNRFLILAQTGKTSSGQGRGPAQPAA